ncbi:MAG: hypothetical protein ACYC0X_11365 [Pirellulaceae bacterium]
MSHQTMPHQTTRRVFLRSAGVTGAALGLSRAMGLGKVPTVSADEAAPLPGRVQLRPEIEPIVRMLEETPRDQLLEEVATRIRSGLSYQHVVTALMLAGVRNVQPRPSVGFKFHAVLVVNSAHLASLGSPDSDRWLPIFWALDYFKEAQARDQQEGDWTMGPVEEAAIPAAADASRMFRQAMENWDEQAADVAVTSLARRAGAQEVFESFFEFGCRDFRSIGHKAIYVANAKRTLECIGWQHAEPILRSLAYALLNHHGEPNPSRQDLEPDSFGRRNQQRIMSIDDRWLSGQPDARASEEMLDVLRHSPPDEACDKAVELLNRGVGPQSIWDAVFSCAAELVMRQPGIVALHAVTLSNALHYAFISSGNDATRRMLLLQNVAFLRLFHRAMLGRGSVSADRGDALQPVALASGVPESLDEIFSDVNHDPRAAAGKVLGYLREFPAQTLIDEARRLVFLKGTDSHDYKFSSTVLEDYQTMGRPWRDRYLAMAVFKLRGSAEPDNPLVERIRKAFAV